jgi:hypothetical protein
MFSVIVLICSIAVQQPDCSPESARATIAAPRVDNELLCGTLGQSTIAGTVIVPEAGKEYVKILCRRSPS